MNTCNNCHKENAKNSKFCIFCGFTINSDPITQPDRYLTDESENYIDEDDLDSLNRQLSILNEKFTNLEHRIRSLEKSIVFRKICVCKLVCRYWVHNIGNRNRILYKGCFRLVDWTYRKDHNWYCGGYMYDRY